MARGPGGGEAPRAGERAGMSRRVSWSPPIGQVHGGDGMRVDVPPDAITFRRGVDATPETRRAGDTIVGVGRAD